MFLSDLDTARRYNQHLNGRFDASIARVENDIALIRQATASLKDLRAARERIETTLDFIITKYQDWASD